MHLYRSIEGGTDMRKTLLASLMVVCLSGCSAHYGQIECETIEVFKDGFSVFKNTHCVDFGHVYEFQNEAGDNLYTDFFPWNVVYSKGMYSAPLKVYATRDSEECVVYEFIRDVGKIGYTKHCYLDLKTRTVEVELIYSDLALSYYPLFREMKGAEEAYECAKKGFCDLNGINNYTVYLDEINKGFERHSFTSWGEEYEITYTELK